MSSEWPLIESKEKFVDNAKKSVDVFYVSFWLLQYADLKMTCGPEILPNFFEIWSKWPPYELVILTKSQRNYIFGSAYCKFSHISFWFKYHAIFWFILLPKLKYLLYCTILLDSCQDSFMKIKIHGILAAAEPNLLYHLWDCSY